jgi:hypothetical protein
MGQQNFDAMNLWSDCVESIEGDVMLPEELMQLIISYICPGHKVWMVLIVIGFCSDVYLPWLWTG